LKKYQSEQLPSHVLLVEDDSITRQMMRRLLEKEGWRIDEAENGRIALDKLKEHPPQLILLDLMMPEMDGFEFVSHLRRNKEWRDIPVVVVTAKNITIEDRHKLNGFVEKVLQKGAYDRAELINEVRNLIVSYTRVDTKVKV
jgi:CheY-like chemotaxis protein